jgi:hypothetical protein
LAQGADITVTAWVSESRPDENVAIEKDISVIDVGVGGEGDRRMGLVRFDLPAGVTPQELVSARLLMKRRDGDEPKFAAGYVTVPWGYAVVSWRDVEISATFPDAPPLCEKEEGDWYGVDVTDTVREWLAGNRPNYGFALTGAEDGKVTSFWSSFGDDAANYPQLLVHYAESAPAERYGKFGYTEMAEEEGNCLSYALRDKNDIYDTDLFAGAEAEEFNKLAETDFDEAMAYFKEKLSAYIEAHKEALAIESWRPLSGFDDPIDPEKEYMIAMKVGAIAPEEAESAMSAFGVFDYHFRVRLDDGRWAEKIPHAASRVTPGSNASFDGGKFPWDANFQWGNPKWTDYYDSPASYFAVTKTAEEFTSHKQ